MQRIETLALRTSLAVLLMLCGMNMAVAQQQGSSDENEPGRRARLGARREAADEDRSAPARDEADDDVEEAADQPASKPDQEQLEREFSERLSGATLRGSYTTEQYGAEGERDGEAADPQAAGADKYTLGEVRKLDGNYWLFETRIQYGEHDVKLPLSVEVQWAGDTPVVTMTDMPVPGLGKFSARVLFYGDSYAGTWSGGDHGGHVWGKITPKADDEGSEDEESKKVESGNGPSE